MVSAMTPHISLLGFLKTKNEHILFNFLADTTFVAHFWLGLHSQCFPHRYKRLKMCYGRRCYLHPFVRKGYAGWTSHCVRRSRTSSHEYGRSQTAPASGSWRMPRQQRPTSAWQSRLSAVDTRRGIRRGSPPAKYCLFDRIWTWNWRTIVVEGRRLHTQCVVLNTVCTSSIRCDVCHKSGFTLWWIHSLQSSTELVNWAGVRKNV